MKTAKQRLYRARQLAVMMDRFYCSAQNTFDQKHPLSQAIRLAREEALATARAIRQEIIDDSRR